MKLGDKDIKLYLGDAEVEKIYLGTEQVYGSDSTPTPSTDVPLDNTFAVKYQGMWAEGYESISYIDDIEMQLSDIGVGDTSLIEELSIGNQTSSINLDGYNFSNCTGLTLAPSVADTTDIHNFPSMKWVNVMGDSFEYQGGSGLFSDMNCCPIYVPEASLSDYQSAWENETTDDCDGTVADRLVGWTPPHDYSQDYFTFEALESGTFTLTIATGVTTGDVTSVSYSLDNGNTWTTTNNVQGQEVVITTPTVNAGDKVLWKGNANRMANNTNAQKTSIFTSTCKYNVEGNIMSLLYGDDFEDKVSLSGKSYCFVNLFIQNSTTLISAENLILPQTLDGYCYYAMFRECRSLTAAPTLAVNTTGNYTCAYMFYNCISMTTAPALPATTLASNCYNSMFYGCSSLTTAPELPATTLVQACYNSMFRGCSSLNYIKCLATDISANNCTSSWLRSVSSTGTFVKAASMSSWDTGISGIPNNWTVQNDDGSAVFGGGGGDAD